MDAQERESARASWRYRGQQRPPQAIEPGPGQESVWDYPRPPAVQDDNRLVQVRLGDTLIAESPTSKRVLETGSPPTFYLPFQAVRSEYLRPESHATECEWKGTAQYFSVCVEDICAEHAAWSYPDPLEPYGAITDHFAFYPSLLACYVDGERVRAQPGGYLGGWITSEIVGPFEDEIDTGDR